MRRLTRSLILAMVLGGVLLVLASSAGAGHETDPRSKNLHPMGDTDDNRPVVTFGEAFFTDMAFKGSIAYQGTWIGGFRTINIAAPGNPKVLAEVSCGTEQGDMGVYRNLVFRSIDLPVAAATPEQTCDAPFADSGFEGIQIFQVDNPKQASADDLVTAVATDCGSHTHTVVPDPANDRVLVYVANAYTGPLYGEDPIWGHQCSEPHNKFQIVEVPLDAPEDAAVIADVPLGLAAEGHHELAVRDVDGLRDLPGLASDSNLADPDLVPRRPLQDCAQRRSDVAARMHDQPDLAFHQAVAKSRSASLAPPAIGRPWATSRLSNSSSFVSRAYASLRPRFVFSGSSMRPSETKRRLPS